MVPARLSAAQLHEPILPLARPVPVALTPDQTIHSALAAIRAAAMPSSLHYFYVVDDQARLVGVVPTRVLLTAAPEQPVADVMFDDVAAIPDWATVLIASEYFATRRLLAFPVVDGGGRLVGVVDVGLFTNDLIDLARRTYDDPIVLALAESVSMQAVTLTMQSLTDGPFVLKRLIGALWKELRTAALLGVACGTVVGTSVWLWRGDPAIAVTIAVAIAASMVVACLLGVAFPAVLHAVDADPRIAAGPVVLALADVATLLFYFGISVRVLA